MVVSFDVQAAIAQRYAQLGQAVSNDPTQERGVLAPHFEDRARVKLASFDYEPLTVLVRKIVVRGNRLEVRAEYVGVHGHNTTTVDHWIDVNGKWRLLDRN